MKKIIFFTARDLSNAGGGERMLVFIANSLSSHYDITILTPYESLCFYEISPNVKIESFGIRYQNNSIIRKLDYFKIIKKLRSILKNVHFDYFIASSSMAITLISLLIKKDYRFYAWEHTSYFAPNLFFLKWFERYNLYKYNVISINSRDVAEYMKFTTNVIQLPNPLTSNPSKYSKYDTKKIISVGRLEKGKGFDLLISIVANIFNDIQDWTLDIYGQDDGEKERLQELINNLNMQERIVIHNPVSNIFDKYAESSIFATTTRFESFGLVLLEAGACGLPCIAYDVPSGICDIIKNGYNGFLIDDLDITGYTEKLKLLINNPENLVEMGNNARKYAQLFSPTNIISKWTRLFN